MTSFYEELSKSNGISDEQENVQSRANIDKWIFRLLLFLLGVMPLVVMGSVEEIISPLISNVEILSSGVKGDLFTHYKALIMILITVVTGLLLLTKILFLDGVIRKTFLNYIFGVLVVAILVSTLFSPNITIALNGQYNRSDGAISWLCYIALMFIAMNIEYPKKVVSYIIYSMIPFVLINFYIILMNFYGKDLLINSNWMKSFVTLFMPEGANISEGSVLVGTLNQWNYMSGMFAIMTTMYLIWTILSKNWIEVITGSIIATMSMLILFMSLSTSGFLTIVIIVPFVLIITIKNSEKRMSIAGLVLFVAFTAPIFHILSQENERVWEESFGFFIDLNPYSKEEVSIDRKLNFENKVYASEKVLELPILPERSLAFGTGRGYIWNETFKLIKERPIVGYGLDSLVYNFPHYQLESRKGMLDENTIVDKAHNTYFAMLYGTGIFGFISLLLIILWNSIVVLKTLIQKNKSDHTVLILGMAVIAYSVQALFNDSIPAISAVAFIFLGIVFFQVNKIALIK